MSKNAPHPVDLHVGSRIRQQRTLLGMSQTDLGEAVGISYQQCQKYEKGANRVSASMMWEFCKVLGIEVAALFEGYREQTPRRRPRSGHSVARAAV